MRLPGPVARAGQLCPGDQLSCRVAECRGDLGEVGGHGGGLDVGEGLGLAGFVGVSDDGDPGQVPGQDIGGGVADQDAFGVLGVEEPDGFADPVGAGFHPFGVVVVAGDDGPDVAVQPVIGQADRQKARNGGGSYGCRAGGAGCRR